jgi:hypothetical protein
MDGRAGLGGQAQWLQMGFSYAMVGFPRLSYEMECALQTPTPALHSRQKRVWSGTHGSSRTQKPQNLSRRPLLICLLVKPKAKMKKK